MEKTEAGETLTLAPGHYDKLGIIHCGVIREGRITVAGDIADLGDGEQMEMHQGRITVSRQGSEYVFTRVD